MISGGKLPTIGSLAAAAASVAGIEIFEMRLRDATQRGRAAETRLRDATQWEAGAEIATLLTPLGYTWALTQSVSHSPY